MMRQLFFIILMLLSATAKGHTDSVIVDTFTITDASRNNRPIPLAVYHTLGTTTKHNNKVVIISHGYNENRPGSYLGYSFIAKHLAEKGCYVISIQHELANDSLVPNTGVVRVVRMPIWTKGMNNILCVINYYKQQHLKNIGKPILIGHSNGGDMSMLMATKHPKMVGGVISLDHRRMPIPMYRKFGILSLRSSDQVADEGVIPGLKDQKHSKIQIVKLANTTHNDMSDNATPAQQAEMLGYIDGFIFR